jgi:hypothetical protein
MSGISGDADGPRAGGETKKIAVGVGGAKPEGRRRTRDRLEEE